MTDTSKTLKRLILLLFAWWIVCTAAYLFITLKIDALKQTISRNGITSTRKLAQNAGLPLLERDMPMLSRMLDEISGNPDIVYASIVDHKNKTIAYTSPELLLPENRKKVSAVDAVNVWEERTRDRIRLMEFSADVAFSGTKIGEIYLAFSADSIVRLKSGFVLAAMASLCVLVIVFFVFYSKKTPLCVGYFSRLADRRLKSPDYLGRDTQMTCPLCGTEKPLTQALPASADLDTQIIIRPAVDTSGDNKVRREKGLNLTGIATKDD
ncbi:MAG: hypothetical protein JRE58_05660, partial [Deltaproteobacteria bacterium]|nr:hypothetical protein [Deltaproteobacteria bacterium]